MYHKAIHNHKDIQQIRISLSVDVKKASYMGKIVK